MNFIEVENVSKSFKKGWSLNCVLENINLTVQQGEFVVLKGENGSGKTTLLNLILGLIKPNTGTIKLMGLSPQDYHSKTQVGYVLQNTEFPSNVKVKELLKLWQSYYHDSLSIDEVLRRVELEEQAESRATDLSGGQKQRLYFALALIGNPQLLILDEPTRNLDDEGYQTFWQQIKIFRQEEITILMVTNNKADQQELDQLTTRTITLIKYSKLKNCCQLVQDISPQRNHPNADLSPTIFSHFSPQFLINILQKQVWFEGLQLLRTPLFLMGILSFAVAIPFLFKFLGESANIEDPTQPLIYICGILLFTLVIERLAKRIAMERAERWLNLLKATPLPPFLYIATKLLIFLLFCSVFLLICFAVAIWQLAITGNLHYWIAVFLTLITGIIPFTLLGLTLGYLIEPKSADSILGWSLIVIPFLSGFWIIPKFSIMPDLIVLSPFYHYRDLVAWAAHIANDGQVFLHILWLVWATGLFGYLAIWSYQREQAIQR